MIANINCDGVFIHFLWATLSRDILGSNNVVRLSNCPSLCERVQFLRVSVNSGNAMSVQAGTLSGTHTHRCDSQSRKEEESPELRLLSLSFSLFFKSLFNPHFTNKIPDSLICWLYKCSYHRLQLWISKVLLSQFHSSASFPPLSRRQTDWFWCHIFLVFWSAFFGHLGMCKAKNQTYFEVVRVPHCVLLIPPHFPTRALSQAASQAGTEPEGQYTSSSILHNGCHLLQSLWLHNIPRYP